MLQILGAKLKPGPQFSAIPRATKGGQREKRALYASTIAEEGSRHL